MLLPAGASVEAGDVIQTHLQAAVNSSPAVFALTVPAGSVDDAAQTVSRADVLVAVVDDLAVVSGVTRRARARSLVCVARASVHAERIVAVLHVTESGERILEVALVAVTPEV